MPFCGGWVGPFSRCLSGIPASQNVKGLFGGLGGLAYAEVGNVVAESLMVGRSSCKYAISCTVSGKYAPDRTMSESSSRVDREGIIEPGGEKQSKCRYRENDKGKYGLLPQ